MATMYKNTILWINNLKKTVATALRFSEKGTGTVAIIIIFRQMEIDLRNV